jgi:ubiquinone biosynthesis protein UbiJ
MRFLVIVDSVEVSNLRSDVKKLSDANDALTKRLQDYEQQSRTANQEN